MSCIGGWRFGSYRLVLWKGKVRCGHKRNPTANRRESRKPLACSQNRICRPSLSQACFAVLLLPHRERSGKSCRRPGGSLLSKLGSLFQNWGAEPRLRRGAARGGEIIFSRFMGGYGSSSTREYSAFKKIVWVSSHNSWKLCDVHHIIFRMPKLKFTEMVVDSTLLHFLKQCNAQDHSTSLHQKLYQ